MIVGSHWHSFRRRYDRPAVSVEHVYLDHPAPLHQDANMQRVALLLANDWDVALKVKYQVGHDTPRESEVQAYMTRLASFLERYPVLDTRRCRLIYGNEPNVALSRAQAAAEVVPVPALAAGFNAFAGCVRGHRPHAQVWLTPIGPSAPFGRGEAPKVETSPWATYAAQFYEAVDVEVDGAALHAYGRVGTDPSHPYNHGALEPQQAVRESHGWRFGFNVIDTWAECLASAGRDGLPLGIVEMNTRTDAPSSQCYPAGWMPHAFDRLRDTFRQRIRFACWFVDHNVDGHWHTESLEGRFHRMAIANTDFELASGSRLLG